MPANALKMAVLAASLMACRTISTGQQAAASPVKVLSITPTYKSDGQADLAVVMEVLNAEAKAGSANRIEWRIWLYRRLFAQGEQLVSQPIGASGSTRLELVLPLALRRAAQAADLVPVELSIRGRLIAVIGGSETELPFAQTLTIRAPPAHSSGAEEE